MSDELNNGAIAIKNSLMRAHEFFAGNREFIDFQIFNVTQLNDTQYLGHYPSICVTLKCNPGRRSIYVRDSNRYRGITKLEPHLPSIYFCIYIGIETNNCAVSQTKREYRTRPTSYLMLHPLLVDTKGQILEPIWPTYDINYGIHNCGVQYGYPHHLVSRSLVQKDFFKEYLVNVWDGFWNSTFTYADQALSKEAGEVARVLKTVGQIPGLSKSYGFYVYDIAGILAAAEHHKIPWSKYPKMNKGNRDYLTSSKAGAGLDFKLNTRATRYREVKKQIENLTW